MRRATRSPCRCDLPLASGAAQTDWRIRALAPSDGVATVALVVASAGAAGVARHLDPHPDRRRSQRLPVRSDGGNDPRPHRMEALGRLGRDRPIRDRQPRASGRHDPAAGELGESSAGLGVLHAHRLPGRHLLRPGLRSGDSRRGRRRRSLCRSRRRVHHDRHRGRAIDRDLARRSRRRRTIWTSPSRRKRPRVPLRPGRRNRLPQPSRVPVPSTRRRGSGRCDEESLGPSRGPDHGPDSHPAPAAGDPGPRPRLRGRGPGGRPGPGTRSRSRTSSRSGWRTRPARHRIWRTSTSRGPTARG